MKRALTILSIVLTITSCTINNENENFNPNDLLLGNWTHEYSDNGEVVFKRTNSLPNENYGVSFLKEGKFVERTSGWCGTPPLVFWNIEGTYELDGTLIKIKTEGYPENYNWRIVSLTNQKLVITYEQTDQEKDHEDLVNLFNELYAMATSKKCNNANDWLITAYGSKACGGPQGFMPYPNSIDVNLFIDKVSQYTQKEHQYNIKWGIISTCDLPAQPSGVKCENDLPVLIY